jgi:hypothetical protein
MPTRLDARMISITHKFASKKNQGELGVFTLFEGGLSQLHLDVRD